MVDNNFKAKSNVEAKIKLKTEQKQRFETNNFTIFEAFVKMCMILFIACNQKANICIFTCVCVC